MRKSFFKILLCLGFVVLGMFSSFACSCRPSADGDDSNLIPDDAQTKISMNSKVKNNMIEINMSSDSNT